MKYAVIIAERNEPDILPTIANIKANSSATVIRKTDTEGKGPQRMRDEGIMEADGFDVVIIMDGHMRVKPGTLDAMAQFAYDHPNTVSCAMCHHTPKEDWTGKPYMGARFAWKAYGKDANEPQSFTAKWRTDTTVGKIPCVMGACYAFRRDWYIDGLLRPWRFGTGWGCDEELISAATWLRGGSVHLLPFAVWHQARLPGKVPYELTSDQTLGVWANRWRMLTQLPLSMDELTEATRHIWPSLSTPMWRKVSKIMEKDDQAASEYRKVMAEGTMSWAYFKENIMEKETIQPMTIQEAREMAKSMGLKVPQKAKIGGILELISAGTAPKNPRVTEKPAKMEKPTPVARANWGANEKNNSGGRCCVHCGGNATTVNDTKRTSGRLITRYRSCDLCGKNFTTRDI